MMEQSFATVSQQAIIDLDVLLRDYLLGLVLIAGGGTGDDTVDRPVQWVHSSDLIDPSPFLTPRTVLLTTGAQFGDDLEPATATAYVRRLLGVGVTALGIAIGIQWDRIPPSLIDACDQLELPLFRVPYDTPFIAVVRTAARLIEAESHTTEPWGREQGPPGSLLGKRQNLAAVEQAVRIAVLQLLVAHQRELAEQIAATLLPRLPRGEIAVLSLSGPFAPRVLPGLNPHMNEQAGVFSARQGERITIIAERAEVSALRNLLSQFEIAAGVSEHGSLSALTELLAQAERANELARLRGESEPIAYRPEMHAGVMQLLQGSPEAKRRAAGLLSPLRRHDERHADELERSITVWLAHHGQTSPASVELGVHRHTLRARVQTAASLLQQDLDSPDARAELWAALQLAPTRD